MLPYLFIRQLQRSLPYRFYIQLKEVNINILASDVNGTDNFKATVQRREGDISSFFPYYSIWVKLFELREVENPVLKLSEMCQLAEWESWQFLFSSENPLPFFPSIHSFHNMAKWFWVQNLCQINGNQNINWRGSVPRIVWKSLQAVWIINGYFESNHQG